MLAEVKDRRKRIFWYYAIFLNFFETTELFSFNLEEKQRFALRLKEDNLTKIFFEKKIETNCSPTQFSFFKVFF